MSGGQYRVGVMKVRLGRGDRAPFDRAVDGATELFAAALRRERVHLDVEVVEFDGPHLTASAGSYAPLELLELGLSEKVERGFHFLIAVTDVELAPGWRSAVLALPSRLTNVGVVSTRHVIGDGHRAAPGEALLQQRVSTLLLHTLGHLLNSGHHPSPTNVMHEIDHAGDLDAMVDVTGEQAERWRENLAREARERTAAEARWRHAIAWVGANAAGIASAVARANPLRLAFVLRSGLASGLAFMVAVFFTFEIWDVGEAMRAVEVATFVLLAGAATTRVLHLSIAPRGGSARGRILTESGVAARTTTALAAAATVVVLGLLFFAVAYVAAAVAMPEPLMFTWPTVDDASRVGDHLRVALFAAGVGVLGASLAARADRVRLARRVLFSDDGR